MKKIIYLLLIICQCTFAQSGGVFSYIKLNDKPPRQDTARHIVAWDSIGKKLVYIYKNTLVKDKMVVSINNHEPDSVGNINLDLSGYVPYTGAHQNVNLENNNLSCKNIFLGQNAPITTSSSPSSNSVLYLYSNLDYSVVPVGSRFDIFKIFNKNGQYGTYAAVGNYGAITFNNTGGGYIVSNSAFGARALESNTTGSRNTILGSQSGMSNTTGSYNTFIGQLAGWSVTSGSYNTFIGASGNYSAEEQIGNNQIILSDGQGNRAFFKDSSGNINLAGTSLKYNNVSIVTSLSGTVTLDFPSTPAATSSDLTVTVTGAAIGDIVSMGTDNMVIPLNSQYTAWVSAVNTVTIRFNNYSTTSQNPPNGVFKVKILK